MNNADSCYSYAYDGVKVKRDYVVFSLVFQIGPQTGIMERARRVPSIDMAVGAPILKFNENTLLYRFIFTAPKWV